jgi:hypothetical protein
MLGVDEAGASSLRDSGSGSFPKDPTGAKGPSRSRDWGSGSMKQGRHRYGNSGSGSFPKDPTGAKGPSRSWDSCSGSMKQGLHRYGDSGSGSFPKDPTGAEGPSKSRDLCSGSMKQGRHRYGDSGSGSFPKDSTGAKGPSRSRDWGSESMKQGRHRYGDSGSGSLSRRPEVSACPTDSTPGQGCPGSVRAITLSSRPGTATVFQANKNGHFIRSGPTIRPRAGMPRLRESLPLGGAHPCRLTYAWPPPVDQGAGCSPHWVGASFTTRRIPGHDGELAKCRHWSGRHRTDLTE